MTSDPRTPIYLDYQATTPMDPRVLDAMLPYLTDQFGNPASTQHRFGNAAETAVETARAQVAGLIGAGPREIVFTSGATESNNLAVKGAARFHKARRPHVVTLETEHKCVLESCNRLKREGHDVTVLPVGADGLVELARLAEAIADTTVLVSIMAVNNEIGVIQPLAEIGALCRAKGAYFHCDAAQAAGKIPIDVEAMAIDLLSISGHKVYGPKGIGALYVRRRPRVRLEPLFDGGGQERGFRAGTLPAAACVGLGEACVIAARAMTEEAGRLEAQRDLFLGLITAALDGVMVNGDLEARIPGNLNLSFAGVTSEDLIAALPELAISSGSACTSASVEPSYVLRALRLPEERAAGGVRIGFGRFTGEDELRRAAALVIAAVDRLRTGAEAAE